METSCETFTLFLLKKLCGKGLTFLAEGLELCEALNVIWVFCPRVVLFMPRQNMKMHMVSRVSQVQGKYHE